MLRRVLPALVFIQLALSSQPIRAADWPTWRFDAQRSGSSPQELPGALHLQWKMDLPPLVPAWPDQVKLQFDAAYDPVIAGHMLYFGSSRWDCMSAFDTRTGEMKWRFFADGPIRFAPLADSGRLYFVSDDGYLYCLNGETGALLWKFRGGPSDRKILGNERLVSTWPARGAPVLVDGAIYFCASIWPFMGIFIHALDAETGKVIWTNDADGSLYMKQPHNTDSFACVAPQGPLAMIGDRLLIPGGRSLPAAFDRRTGKLLKYQLAENGHKGGGWEVFARGGFFFNGGACFDLATEKYLGDYAPQVVLSKNNVIAYNKGSVRIHKLQGVKVPEPATVSKTKESPLILEELSVIKTDPATSLIKAGKRVFLGGKDFVQALEIGTDAKSLEQGWWYEIDGTVKRLIAGDDRLIAVTDKGNLYCFGKNPVPKPALHVFKKAEPQEAKPDDWSRKAARILKATGVRTGNAVVWGASTGRLAEELARHSQLDVIVVEPDPAKIAKLRKEWLDEDLLGHRLHIIPGDINTVQLPPYLATLMVAEDASVLTSSAFEKAYASLRPFGGVFAWVRGPANAPPPLPSLKGLAQADLFEEMGVMLLRRKGALPGSANWTHENADAQNTRVSKDQLVKAPLGVLWFGGPSHEQVLPRHGHGPQPQVIDGRLLIEGLDMLRAMDIYTGRLLWEAKLPGVGQLYNNVSHQPGANSSGSNFVCTSDSIYVAYKNTCVVLDPATGKKVKEFRLPADMEGGKLHQPLTGYVNVADDYLLVTADPLLDAKSLPPRTPILSGGIDGGTGGAGQPEAKEKKNDLLSKVLGTLRGMNDNYSSSRHMYVLNRHTGELLWSRSSESGFRHNSICIGGGRVYAIDRLSGPQIERLKKEGKPAEDADVLCLDLKTGTELWKHEADIFGTWLSYSVEYDILVEAGRVARDSLSDEPKGMRAYDAKTGKTLWFDKGYAGPAMIHHDTILQGQGACDLRTGKLKMRDDPLTGQAVPWTWIRNYGCNTPAASEHLLTFRSGAAGYFDLCRDGGTGNFGGFRSSCTNNLMVAGGILTAPEYTRTCTCAYQNQSSIALIHMPEIEMWTHFGSKEIKGPIQRVGINLGAAGDRRSDGGTLWIEHPSVAGISPPVNVVTKPAQPNYFRRHSSLVTGGLNWVASSGVRGASEITVNLGKGAKIQPYTIRLVFMEPEDLLPGQRKFHVFVQGQEVLRDFDILQEAGGSMRSVFRDFPGIIAGETVTIRLDPVLRDTILCGIEILAEGKK